MPLLHPFWSKAANFCLFFCCCYKKSVTDFSFFKFLLLFFPCDYDWQQEEGMSPESQHGAGDTSTHDGATLSPSLHHTLHLRDEMREPDEPSDWSDSKDAFEAIQDEALKMG